MMRFTKKGPPLMDKPFSRWLMDQAVAGSRA